MDLTLALMDLNHLIAHADMVAVTDLEHELLKRIEKLDNELAELATLTEFLDKSGLSVEDVREIWNEMVEYGCEVGELRKMFKRADDFYDLVQDIKDDILPHLSKLVEEIS